jgi:hypothetical protein
MTETEVTTFLATARTLNIATIDPRDAILIVAIWFVMHDANPVFWTYAKSQVLRIGEELSAKYSGPGSADDVSTAATKRVCVVLRPDHTISWDHRELLPGSL